MNNKAVLYLRLSKEDRNKVNKGDDSESIINQRIMLSDYAMRHNFRLLKYIPMMMRVDYMKTDRDFLR